MLTAFLPLAATPVCAVYKERPALLAWLLVTEQTCCRDSAQRVPGDGEPAGSRLPVRWLYLPRAVPGHGVGRQQPHHHALGPASPSPRVAWVEFLHVAGTREGQ